MRFIIPIQFRFLMYHGMAMYPFLFLKNRNLVYDKIFINHERIHFRQQLEMLIIPFYIIYFTEYFVNLWHYRNHVEAYMNICFEREAFEHQQDLNYLQNRKFWTFLNYWN
ncbi:MAG: hypothetical protein RI955_513 [Bacteroidota bacterium]|jgi:hypothetical protein